MEGPLLIDDDFWLVAPGGNLGRRGKRASNGGRDSLGGDPLPLPPPRPVPQTVTKAAVRTQPREVFRKVKEARAQTLQYGSSRYPGIRLITEDTSVHLPQVLGTQDEHFLCVPEPTLNDVVCEEDEEEEEAEVEEEHVEELLVSRVPTSVSKVKRRITRKEVTRQSSPPSTHAPPVSPPKKLTRHIPTTRESKDPTASTYVPKMFTNKEFHSLPAPQSPVPAPLEPPLPSPRQSADPAPSPAPAPTPVKPTMQFRSKIFEHSTFSLTWDDLRPRGDGSDSETDTLASNALDSDTDGDGDLSVSPKNVSDSDVSSVPPQPQAPPVPYVPKLFNPVKRAVFSTPIPQELKKKESLRERPVQTPSKSPPSSPQNFEKKRYTPKKRHKALVRESPAERKERRGSLPSVKEARSRRDNPTPPPTLPFREKDTERRQSTITESSTEGSPTFGTNLTAKQKEEKLRATRGLADAELEGRQQQDAKEQTERMDLRLRERRNVCRIAKRAVEKEEAKFRVVIAEIESKSLKELHANIRREHVLAHTARRKAVETGEVAARQEVCVIEVRNRDDLSSKLQEEGEELRATPVKHVTIAEYNSSPEETGIPLAEPPSILLLEENTPVHNMERPDADLSSIATPLPEVRDEDDEDEDPTIKDVEAEGTTAEEAEELEETEKAESEHVTPPQLPPLQDESEEDPFVPEQPKARIDLAPLQLEKVPPKQPRTTPRAMSYSSMPTEATGSARTIPSARQQPGSKPGCGGGCGTSCSIM